MKSLDRVMITKVVGSAVVLLVLAVGYLFVVSPRLAEVDEIRTQTEDVRSSNQVVSASVADLEEKKAGLDDARRTAAELERRFPARAVQADMFADVRLAARRAGIADVDVTALTPTVPQAAGSAAAAGGATLPEAGGAPVTGLATMKVTATVTGTRDQLRRFLAAMEDLDRAYLFDTAALSPDGEGAGTAGDGTTAVPSIGDLTDGTAEVDLPDDSEGEAVDTPTFFTLTVSGTMFLLPAVVDPDDPPVVTETPAADAPADAPADVAGAPAP